MTTQERPSPLSNKGQKNKYKILAKSLQELSPPKLPEGIPPALEDCHKLRQDIITYFSESSLDISALRSRLTDVLKDLKWDYDDKYRLRDIALCWQDTPYMDHSYVNRLASEILNVIQLRKALLSFNFTE